MAKSTCLAAFPMYDFDELQAAHDGLWAAVAMRLERLGIAAPPALTRGLEVERVWTHPALLLGQTCGYPLVTSLKGKVVLVATPCYGVPGCHEADYCSAVVVRATEPATCLLDMRGRNCAMNDAASNSGMNLLRAEIATLNVGRPRFFGEVIVTGGHAASVQAVASGIADIAAIDCVTWSHLQRFRPAWTRHLRVLAWTRPSPGLPLITSLGTDAATQAALVRVLDEVTLDPALAAVRGALRLEGFRVLPLGTYETVSRLERRAIEAGYPVLR